MAGIAILPARQWAQKLLALPDAGGVWAFYDHRLGAIVRDPGCALVPVDDHLVHRADGVFEYILFRDRGIIDLNAHLDRLRRSARALEITLPCPAEHLRDVLVAVAAASGRDDGALRVLLSRGQGGFGLDPAECPAPGLYVIAHAAAPVPESLFARGASACRSRIPAKAALFAGIKSTNYMSGILMCLEAAHRGVDYSLSFDDDGCLAEAAQANVALVDAAGVLVVPEFRNALIGTTIRKAGELIGLALPHVRVQRRTVPEEELFAARELMLLGTVHECLPIVRYEDRPVGTGEPGPVARALRRLLREHLRQERVVF
jgi:branched-chain amino acid aminotransferase